jgi:hypothetical protein
MGYSRPHGVKKLLKNMDWLLYVIVGKFLRSPRRIKFFFIG